MVSLNLQELILQTDLKRPFKNLNDLDFEECHFRDYERLSNSHFVSEKSIISSALILLF